MARRFRLQPATPAPAQFRQTVVLPAPTASADSTASSGACGCIDADAAWLTQLIQQTSGYYPLLTVEGRDAVVTGESEVRIGFALTGQLVDGHDITPTITFTPTSGSPTTLIPTAIVETGTVMVWYVSIFSYGSGEITFAGGCGGEPVSISPLQFTYSESGY